MLFARYFSLLTFAALFRLCLSKSSSGSTNDDETKAPLSAHGIEIDFILSNYWNNTMFLAQSNPSIVFKSGVTTTQVSINSTPTSPDIIGVHIKENRQFQKMIGHGAGITDATSIILQDLKQSHPEYYDEILNLAFNPSKEWLDKGGAGMNIVRVPIGASDFGFTEYTYDDTYDGSDDPQLTQFNIEKSAKRWITLQDIVKIQPNLLIMASPWSQPAWMKGKKEGSLHGGSVLEKYESVYADYLVRFVKDLDKKKGLKVNRLSLQNEPLYDGAQYPCTKMLADQQARIGDLTRTKLDAQGYKNVGILAYDHNWDAADYPVQVLDAAIKGSFSGVAWHCYGGDPSGQLPFDQAYPDKEVWFTECTRIDQYFEEPWVNIKKQFIKLITGSINFGSMTTILWNMVLMVTEEGFTRPSLPQTCRNCLSAFQVLESAIGQPSERINTTAYSRLESQDTSSLPSQAKYGKFELPKKSNSLNLGADNEKVVVNPVRPTYYRTSDYSTLAHLGRAIRPTAKSESWGQRVGVTTTEDGNEYPRLYSQLFKRNLGNGSSRWSMILLQQNDHQGYNYASFEDMTIQIDFRGATAQITLPPGAYTLQWTAPDL